MLKFKQFVSYLKESLTDEAMILERSNVEKLHFEMDPKKAEKLKIEIGYAQGEISKRKQIEGANYSLRRFRKEIGYWDGNKRDQEWAEGVFAGPEHYNTVKSTLGAGPHKKKVEVKRWNQKLYDKWIKDMATNNDGEELPQDYGFEMAQNANFENGLIDWVKKNNRGEDPLQIIQWDIEGMMESTVNEGKMPDKYIGNDEIVFLKTKEDNRGAHYNLYYKGHDIDVGGRSFKNGMELTNFADDYILSNQLYNKLKYVKAKPLPESVIEENLNEAIKYETKGYKLGDKIKTNFGEWEIIETDYKPNKSFTSPFVFKGDKLERLPLNVKSTEKTAVGYKVTDGAKYPTYGFLYQYKGKLGNKMLITKLATIGVDESVVTEAKMSKEKIEGMIWSLENEKDSWHPSSDSKKKNMLDKLKKDLSKFESVVTEAKNTIGLAFKDEDDYTGFVEFIKDEKGSIKKDFGWDSKTKSWEVIMDVKVLDKIYGEGTPGNKESGWYGALPGDFESVIIESVVNESKDMTFTDYLKVLDTKFEDAMAAVKGENGIDTEITPTRGDILQNFTLFRNYVSSLTKKYKGDKTKLRFLTEKVREYEFVINESFVNEARAYKLKASEFGSNTHSAAYNVKGEPTWRVHSTYAIDQISGDGNPEERDVVFFESMPINNDIYIKIGGINNLSRSNGATYGNNFGTTIEEWKKDPKGIAKEASKFLTDATHLKWLNKKASSEGQTIKWALKDDYSSVIEDLVNKSLGLKESIVNEGGNAVEESRPMKQSEVIETFKWAEKNVLPKIGLSGNGIDYAPIGSYAKKNEDATSGDIDIAVSVDKIAGVNGLTFEEVLPWLDTKLKSLGYSTKAVRGFEQISFGAPINGDFKNGVGQIDIMLSTDLNWSKFMYHSPNFITGESKYKGMYRNVLLMSIVSEMFKESSKLTPEGDTEQYKQYVIRLEKGIYQVEKSFMGKRGSLVKTAKLLKDQDKFITNTPEEVVELAFGEGVKPLEVMTFEDAWVRLRSPKFPHAKKLNAILERFKVYILASKMPLPSEAVEAYPNLF